MLVHTCMSMVKVIIRGQCQNLVTPNFSLSDMFQNIPSNNGAVFSENENESLKRI